MPSKLLHPEASPEYFTTLIELVTEEQDRINCDIEDLDQGEVLSFEDAAQYEAVRKTLTFVEGFEATVAGVQKITGEDNSQFLRYKELEGHVIDDLLAKAIDQVYCDVQDLIPECDSKEICDEVIEACQCDGEDPDAVRSSLQDLSDDFNLPDEISFKALHYEQIVLFLVDHLLIDKDGSAVKAIQHLNEIIH